MSITALTAYNVTIPKTFYTRKDALAWAPSLDAQQRGCVKLVQATKRGLRTIWRPAQEIA